MRVEPIETRGEIQVRRKLFREKLGAFVKPRRGFRIHELSAERIELKFSVAVIPVSYSSRLCSTVGTPPQKSMKKDNMT